jgi:hypothetical protein
MFVEVHTTYVRLALMNEDTHTYLSSIGIIFFCIYPPIINVRN